jgi:D-glycero-alpha-D-manno-heptose-7-phosphate kinase
MIITRTPLRVSFLGGGTDYPDHFQQHGGQTLGVAIDKYTYITLKGLAPIFDHSFHVSYRKTELVRDVAEIQHPSVRECCRLLGIAGGVEVHYVGDLPARSGLGSSSSFTVGLLHALHAYRGELVSQPELAAEAVHVERELIGERVGYQDQYTCALGGLLQLEYPADGPVRVQRIPLGSERLAELEGSLMLFYTGIQRMAHQLLDEQIEKTRAGTITNDLCQLAALVDDGIRILTGRGPVSAFGELLHEAWSIKRGLSSKITTELIDQQYALARQAGAVGGKLLGAGGGGFLLLLADPEAQPAIERAVELPRVPLAFDAIGTSLLFCDPRTHAEPARATLTPAEARASSARLLGGTDQ